MKYLCEIEDIKLCSINDRLVRGQRVLSQAYRACKEELIYCFNDSKSSDFETLTGPLSISLEIEQYADWDNYLKIISDSLEKAEVIKNDRLIVKAEITKTPIKRGAMNKLKVCIW